MAGGLPCVVVEDEGCPLDPEKPHRFFYYFIKKVCF
jgi:hypothetical protein